MAKDGICQDGGDGDFQASTSHVYKPKSARNVNDGSGRDAFEFERIDPDEPAPAIGSHLMISVVDYWDNRGDFGIPSYGDPGTAASCGTAACASARDHPMVAGFNRCLNGFDATIGSGHVGNRQTGPLEVVGVDYYDDPTIQPDSVVPMPQLIRITARAVEGSAYVSASGDSISCSAAAAPGYSPPSWGCGDSNDQQCGQCFGYANEHHRLWTETSTDNYQGYPFDCMDVTGVILSTVRPQCTYGSDRCASEPPSRLALRADPARFAGATAATARTSSPTATPATRWPGWPTTGRTSGRSRPGGPRKTCSPAPASLATAFATTPAGASSGAPSLAPTRLTAAFGT